MTASPTPWRSRIVGHADVAPAELVPNPRNWRSHPVERRRALGGALNEVGWVTEVIVNQTTGQIVDGHLRIELALSRNEPAVPVTYVELSEAEEGLVLATLDPIGAMADAEVTAFNELLAQLEPADGALQSFLDDLSREYEVEHIRPGLVDPDEAPDVPDEPRVTRGELYALGDHRLLCGDAADAADVHRAFGDRGPSDMLWTDPPYGVGYQTKLSTEEAVARHRRTDGLEVANDQPEDIPGLLAAAFGHAQLRPGGSFYPVAAQGRSIYKTIRGRTYASCWTASEAESAAMWGLYLGTGGGVAIRSSVGRLIRSLRDHPDPILVGRVRYIDYETGGIPDGNALNPHFYKRKSFAHEREVRALLWPQSILLRDVDTTHAIPDDLPNGIDLAADLDALVDAVFVNPAAPLWFADLVGRAVTRYGRAWVQQSDLDKDPIF